MNPYSKFVGDFAKLFKEGRSLPQGNLSAPAQPAIGGDAARVLIFSPHPDDEVIIGGLPLRLLRELKMNVVNVAVTQGSNKSRQQERWKELSACCNYIGFGLIQTREGGLEGINLKARSSGPAEWTQAVKRIADILRREQPRIIFFPHEEDWNSSHIGTHHLVIDALVQLGEDFSCSTVETEFWGAMDSPNLMIESSERDVTDLISALSFHVGEVRRNPYHLRMPAWLMDNVRRGGELVGGQGSAVPDFLFATLYRLREWKHGAFKGVLEKGRLIGHTESLESLFSASAKPASTSLKF